MPKDNKTVCVLLSALLILFALFATPARAVTVSIIPASQSITQGGSATVDLNISGLSNFATPSLGAFLVEITFDESILSFDTVSYGPFLGDPADPFETDIITTVGAGSVSLDEFSFLFDFELDALQPADFTLATLQFNGDTVGTSALGFSAIDLSDAAGFTIVPTLEISEITVVPLPPSILLFMSGFMTIIFGARPKISCISVLDSRSV